jgi:putative ABC transport system permease protein
MRWEYQSLSYLQVAWACALIAVNAAVSVLLRLNLGRQIFLAAIRTVVQLLLVGLVLAQVFAIRSLPLVLALMLAMTVIAAVASVRRTHRRFPGIWWSGIVAIWTSSWLTAILALTVVVQVRPWYLPQYAIPLLGMILGNALNGVSLGLDRLTEELVRRRGEIESMLALGADRWEAAHDAIVMAVRTGMIPILNAMMVVGIVSLPGMMTGQLLAGVEPIEAVKYQVVIMFVIAAATALGTVMAVLLSFNALFNRRHQFLFHRIRSSS